MRLKLEDWHQHLQQPSLKPVYLISGDEVLLIQEAVAAFVTRARSLGFDEIERWVLEPGFDWEQLLTSAQALSLFALRKVILVLVPTAELLNEAASQYLNELVTSANEDQVVLIQVFSKLEKKIQNQAWVKSIDQMGVQLPVWPLNLTRMPGWLQQRAQQVGLRLTPMAVKSLIDHTEGNLLAASQAIEKMAVVHQGDCDIEHLEGVLVDYQRYDVFALSEACIEGNSLRALKIFRILWEEGTEPTLLLWALAREIRLMYELRYRPQSEWQKLGVWPRRQRPYQMAINRTSNETLEVGMKSLARMDQLIKQRTLASNNALIHMGFEYLILSITGSPLFIDQMFWDELEVAP